jgi:hypothetical protein
MRIVPAPCFDLPYYGAIVVRHMGSQPVVETHRGTFYTRFWT